MEIIGISLMIITNVPVVLRITIHVQLVVGTPVHLTSQFVMG